MAFTLLFVFSVFESCVHIPEVTAGNGQLMTHNHKAAVHMRTMSAMLLILLRPASEILNQCLKAFTLFMHNLTPTTAIDARRIFGEDESGRVEVLNPRPFCEMMKERRKRLIKWPELHRGQNMPGGNTRHLVGCFF